MMTSITSHEDRDGKTYWIAQGSINGKATIIEGETKFEVKIEWAKLYYECNMEIVYGY